MIFYMATAEYHERKVLFEFAVQSGRHAIEHPDFNFTDHPYAEKFVDMLDNATFGVVDVNNGIIHAMDCLRVDGVAIVPLTHADTRRIKPVTKITFADEFLKEAGTSPVHDLSHLRLQQAECRIEEGLVSPVIILHPRLGLRSRLQVGSTVIHELDHAYWDRNQAEVWRFGDMESLQSDIAMEVSAYSLEERVFIANAPQLYADALRAIRAKYEGFDFTSQSITFKKGANHLLRNMRTVAFINLMFKHYGIKVGDYPGADFLNAMKAQELVNIDKPEISD